MTGQHSILLDDDPAQPFLLLEDASVWQGVYLNECEGLCFITQSESLSERGLRGQ